MKPTTSQSQVQCAIHYITKPVVIADNNVYGAVIITLQLQKFTWFVLMNAAQVLSGHPPKTDTVHTV